MVPNTDMPSLSGPVELRRNMASAPISQPAFQPSEKAASSQRDHHGNTRPRLYYLSPRDVRKNRADAVHVMKSCDSFANLGFDVTLVTPRVTRPGTRVPLDQAFSLYGLSPQFAVRELPTVLTDGSSMANSRLQKLVTTAAYFIKERLAGRLDASAIIYAKCYAAVAPVLLLRRSGVIKAPVIFEKADFAPDNRWHRFCTRESDGIICINDYIRTNVMNHYGIPAERVYRLGFTTQHPEIQRYLASDRVPDRASLGLPTTGSLVMYAGKVSPEMREIQYILEAARAVPERQFVLVGVRDDFRPWFEEYARQHGMKNLTLAGFQPLERFYAYVRCADVLLSYYDTLDPLSSTQRAPGKAGVYLSFGKPVIMADLPSLREWWTDEQIFFVPPDQPALLAERIRYIFDHPEEASARAAQALAFARENTYASVFARLPTFFREVGWRGPPQCL